MTEPGQSPECPACGSSLELQQFGSLEIDQCPECGGLWFDPQELADYLAHHKAASTGVDWAGRCRDAESGVTRLNCPRCEASDLHACKWGELKFNRCERCFGAYVGRTELESFLASVGKAKDIGGGEALISAVGSMAGIISRFFVHRKPPA